jgi:hypothetical protein
MSKINKVEISKDKPAIEMAGVAKVDGKPKVEEVVEEELK